MNDVLDDILCDSKCIKICNATEHDLAAVIFGLKAYFPIEKIQIEGISKVDLGQLFDALLESNVKEIELSDPMSFANSMSSFINYISKTDKLEFLYLKCINRDNIGSIATAIQKNISIKKLRLQSRNVSGINYSPICYDLKSRYKCIEQLSLINTVVDDTTVSSIRNCIIVKLEIAHSTIQCDCLSFYIQNNRYLKELSIYKCISTSNTKINDIYCSLSKNKRIEGIEITQNYFTHSDVAQIVEVIKTNINLKKLHLWIPVDHIRSNLLVDAIQFNKGIKNLGIGILPILDYQLGKIINNNILINELHIDLATMTDIGILIISNKVKSNTFLKVLNIRCNVTQKCLETLFESITSSSLEELRLILDKIDDSTIDVLSNCIVSNTHLKKLKLICSNISNYGYDKLFEALSVNYMLDTVNLTNAKQQSRFNKLLTDYMRDYKFANYCLNSC